jgi:hypothetical protein
MSFDVGQASVINVTQATRLAENHAGLNPANYSLAVAEFEPGVIKNHTLTYPANWNLWFAQVHHGYWLYGQGAVEASSKYVALDAVSGSVLKSQSFRTTEPVAGNYTMRVNASQALSYVRALGPLPSLSLSSALIRNGSVTSIAPRIIEFGPSSIGFSENLFNASLSGQERLCWVITLSDHSGTGGSGSEGTFAVDAQSGELLSLSTERFVPSSPGPPVSASLVPASAQNLTIFQETFQADVNAVGLPHSVTVKVPGIVVARPGSTASIQVKFSSTIQNYVAANLAFSNPMPGLQDFASNGLPPGVSASFSNRTLTLAGAAGATRTVMLTIDRSAPSGTYLVSLNAVPPDLRAAATSVSFFLTVWDGMGQFPPPPLLKTGTTAGSTTTANAATITATVGALSNPPSGCVLANKVSSQGYSIEIYLPGSPRVGDKVCLDVIFRNVDSGSSPDVQRIIQRLNITDSNGKSVFAEYPVVLATGTLTPGHYIEGTLFWDSHNANPGTYRLHVDYKVPADGLKAAIELTADADITLTN